MRLRRILFTIVLSASAACAGPASEYQVKAAFLLNFTRFVEWPPSAFPEEGAALTVCVLGDDPFGNALDQVMEGESAGGRKLAVRRIQEPPSQRACQVLFVAHTEKSTARILTEAGPGVLTVGENDAFLREGGMIAFVVDGRHVRFDINHRAAARASVALSSRLLSVARTVLR